MYVDMSARRLDLYPASVGGASRKRTFRSPKAVCAGDDGHRSHLAALCLKTPARICAGRGRVTGSLSWIRGGAGRASQLAVSRAGQSARMVLGQPTPKRKVLLNAGAFPGASRVPGVCVVQVWVPAFRRRRALFSVGRYPAFERRVFGMRCVYGSVCTLVCCGGWQMLLGAEVPVAFAILMSATAGREGCGAYVRVGSARTDNVM